MSKQVTDATVAYRSAKAVQQGQKLWCLWSDKEPYGALERGNKTGFVISSPADMRKMAADLFRLADAIEEIESMWSE